MFANLPMSVAYQTEENTFSRQTQLHFAVKLFIHLIAGIATALHWKPVSSGTLKKVVLECIQLHLILCCRYVSNSIKITMKCTQLRRGHCVGTYTSTQPFDCVWRKLQATSDPFNFRSFSAPDTVSSRACKPNRISRLSSASQLSFLRVIWHMNRIIQCCSGNFLSVSTNYPSQMSGTCLGYFTEFGKFAITK